MNNAILFFLVVLLVLSITIMGVIFLIEDAEQIAECENIGFEYPCERELIRREILEELRDKDYE